MNEIFKFHGQQVRTVMMNNTPWFIGKDIATILGYERPTKAIQDHVDDEDKDVVPIQDSIGRNQKTPIINESGLYSLILSSKLPQAKEFKRWVTTEVLPSIRKKGAYVTDYKAVELVNNPNALGDFLQGLTDQVKALETKLEKQKPKVLFADSVSASKTSILVGDLAKLLKQNGVEIGQRRLFEWLRNNNYLIKRNGSDRNMPTQRSMEQGLFEIKESTYANPDGSIKITKTTKVTGKGQVFFVNKFLGA